MTFNKFLCNHKLISLALKCLNSICLNMVIKLTIMKLLNKSSLPCFIKPNQPSFEYQK